MEERYLGRSGLRVSVVGLGGNNFGLWGNQFGTDIDFETTRAIVHKALDVGITLFDTADVYGKRGGSETALGKVLGDRRKDIVLATKFSAPMDDSGRMRGGSRRYIMMAVEASLKRLNTDWIDIYQMHRNDPLTPIEETLRAVDDLIRAGKVRYFGASLYDPWRLVEAQLIARQLNTHAFISCQDEYNLLARDIELDLIPAIEKYGVGLLPFFPLASGLLTGKYRKNEPAPAGSRLAQSQPVARREFTDQKLDVVEQLRAFCTQRGHSMLDLALSWLAGRPTVASIMAGVTRPEQVEQNVKAVEWKLTADESAEVDRMTMPLRRQPKTTPMQQPQRP